MKIALAQINTTVGDFEGNLAKIESALDRARREGLDLVVFPEQTIPGYPAEDLLEREDFLRAVESAFDRAVRLSRGTAMVIGTVRRAAAGRGNPIHNSAVLAVDGRVEGVQHKTLLPTYDVFDEGRYFRVAQEYAVFPFRGRRLGLAICEDLWNDPGYWPEGRYEIDPVSEIAGRCGADLLVAISASPFSVGRQRFRHDMLRVAAVRYGVDLVYCNLVGGNTTLVFDGASLALDGRGRLRVLGASFEEDFVVVDLDAPPLASVPERLALPPAREGPGRAAELPDCDVEAVWGALVLGTRDYLHKTGFRRAVVGLSGGIDSALTAAVAVEALGAENVTGVALPSRYSSEGSVADAVHLARNLGIRLHELSIEEMFQSALRTLAPLFEGLPQDVTEENIQARIRGLLLMALSNKSGALLLTTGNKSEVAVGYCTLYGDMSGGLAVISDVPKTLVYRLAGWLNRERELIPWATVRKEPSAELRPGQKDRDSLPPYDVLDSIVEAYVEQKMGPEEIAALGHDRELVERVLRMIDRSEYKRKQAAPGLRITEKDFGRGRRVPIVERFRK
ncbi:MAG: NAD+ synthase [Planctomycetes bacterium]|nr:NAD+ synthase [Planctomycetota bacterium]